MTFRHKVRNQRRARRRRKRAARADEKQHCINGENVLCVVARQLDQRARAEHLQRVTGQDHASAVESISHMACRKKKNQPRQKQRQPRVTQVDGAVRNRVHLPRHRDRLRFGAQDHGHARQLVSPEILRGKGLQAAARLWGSGLHGLLSGYNAVRSAASEARGVSGDRAMKQ